MAGRNPDVQDLTASEPSAAGTDVHVVKKRGILGFLNKGINKVVTALSPSKATSGTATPNAAAPTSTGKRLFSGTSATFKRP
jgi:hypothetical protein